MSSGSPRYARDDGKAEGRKGSPRYARDDSVVVAL